jgi:hypothetical protein
MDAIGIGWIIATTITGALFAGCGLLTLQPARWACLAMSFLPIVAMFVISGPEVPTMASRVFLSLTIGAIAGGLFLVGTVELLHSKAEAQMTKENIPTSPPPAPTSTGSITTTGQSGGINSTGNLTINKEDTSVKRKMRDLLDRTDGRILYSVSQHQTTLNIRMQPFEFDKLQALIAEDKSDKLVTVLDVGPIVHGNTINNGSLGPTQSVDQRNVRLSISPDILKGGPDEAEAAGAK